MLFVFNLNDDSLICIYMYTKKKKQMFIESLKSKFCNGDK